MGGNRSIAETGERRGFQHLVSTCPTESYLPRSFLTSGARKQRNSGGNTTAEDFHLCCVSLLGPVLSQALQLP